MGADGGADQHLGAACGVEADLADLIEQRGIGQFILLLHFLRGESPNEDGGAVPDDLKYFSWWYFGDIHLKVGVPIVPGPSVESADDGDGVEAGEVGHGGVVDSAQHVDLGAADIGFVLVVHPVFIEPVVKGGLEVDVVAEVAGTGGGHEELGLVGDRVVVIQLLGGALVVLGDETEVEGRAWVGRGVRLVSCAACLSLDRNNILLIKYYRENGDKGGQGEGWVERGMIRVFKQAMEIR